MAFGATSNAARVMTGARAKLAIHRPGATPIYIGIFSHVSYAMQYQIEPIYILGRFSATDTEYVSQDTAKIDCTGWRVVGAGPHKAGHVPHLDTLMHEPYLQMTIADRLGAGNVGDPAKVIATFRNVRATGYHTTMNARGVQELSVSFVGILVDDEDGDNDEAAGAMNLDTNAA